MTGPTHDALDPGWDFEQSHWIPRSGEVRLTGSAPQRRYLSCMTASGPLSPGVYLRRRAVAGACCAAIIVLLAWTVGRLVGAADRAPVPVGPARAVQPPSSRPAPLSSGASVSVAPSVAPSTAASTVPAVASSVPPATGPASQPTPPPAAPPPPRPCPDAAVQVLAEAERPSYLVGEHPLLRLVIANAGTLPCLRDVSRTSRALVITSADGGTRLWSSSDCYAPPGTDSRLLQPGERLTFTVTWAGRTSAPGCPSRRRTVPAGSYLLTAKLGALTSPPVPVRLSR
jgi:hypothetical protein